MRCVGAAAGTKSWESGQLKPGRPRMARAVANSDGSVTVSWQPPNADEGVGEVTSYVILARRVG